MNTVHRLFLSTPVLAGLFGMAVATPLAAQSVRTESYQGRSVAAGEAIVRFRGASVEQSLSAAARAVAADSDLVSSNPVGGQGAVLLRSNGRNIDELLQAYANRSDVMYIGPNYIVRASDLPNDSFFNLQWGLKNTGQSVGASGAGTADVDIRTQQAWDITQGSRSFVIGVVDTGVAYNHPDLVENMWTAPLPFQVIIGGQVISCAAGTRGYNAIAKTCDPADDNGHGTHVAGILGASGNNGLGVSGINRIASIMALKALDSTGTGTVANVMDALEFAVQAKATFGALANVRILNNSYGLSTTRAGLDAFLAQMNSAATSGMLFVASAGNGGVTNDAATTFFPSSFVATDPGSAATYVISVAATDNKDNLASFSNFGATSVNIGAPGVDIFSTWPSGTYKLDSGTQTGPAGTLTGSSMSSAMVSGAAALVLSACPNLSTNALLRAALLDANSVDAIPSLTGRTTSGGRLNVIKAMTQGCAAASNGFTLTASQGFKTVGVSSTAVSTVTMGPVGTFNGTVAISVSAPEGITASLAAPSLTNGAPLTTLTINVGANVAPGVYAILVTGTSGAFARSTSVSLTVAPTVIAGSLGASGDLSTADPPVAGFLQSYFDPYRLVLGATTTLTVVSRASAFEPFVELVSATGVTIAPNSTGFTGIVIAGVAGTAVTTTYTNRPAGTYFINVRATTADGSGNPRIGAYTLAVNGAPSLDSITVTAGTRAQGTNSSVTLAGSGFPASAAITTNDGLGVTGTFTTNAAGNSATGTITVATNTTPGVHNLAVVTSLGTSGTAPFTVTPGIPTFTSISPNTATRGTNFTVTVTGTNLNGGNFTVVPTIANNILTSPVTTTVLNGTTATTAFTIGAGASTATQSVFVSTAGGTTPTLPYTMMIATPVPTLTAVVTPSQRPQGVTAPFTLLLSGNNFDTREFQITIGTTGSTVGSPVGITINSFVVRNINAATVTLTPDAGAVVGPRTFTVHTVGGTSNTIGGFSINPPVPQLTSIAPTFGAQGTSVPVTITGVNLAAGPITIDPSGTDVTVSSVNIVSPTTVTAIFSIANDVPANSSNRTILVISSVGTSNNSVSFTVDPAVPTLSSVTPIVGGQGKTIPITITGTNFVPSVVFGFTDTVNVSGTGVTGGTVTVQSSTTAVASLVISSTATPGARNLTFTDDGGTTNPVTFTVQSSVLPTLTGVTPNTAQQGQTIFPITLFGTNFITSSVIQISPSTGITNGAVTLVNDTILTTTLNVSAGAALGARTILVGTSAGSTNTLPFTVVARSPITFTSLTPASGVRGTEVPITVTGTNFNFGGFTIGVLGNTNINVGFIGVAPDGNSATARLTIGPAAQLGTRAITVATVAGSVATSMNFQILSPLPRLLTVVNPQPAFGAQGTTALVTLSGANFDAGSFAVSVSGTGVTAGSFTVQTAGSATGSFTIAPDAQLGLRAISVSTVVGASLNTVNYTILQPAPTLTGITPNTGAPGTTVPVTLTGTNFTAGMLSGIVGLTGVTTTSIVTLSTTTATMTFVIPTAAAMGTRYLTVRNLSGTSDFVKFTVQDPPLPTLTSITPSQGGPGQATPVTLIGTNFLPGLVVTISGGSVNLSPVVVVTGSTTTATTTITVVPTATPGTRGIVVSTASGTSNSLPFTVFGALQPTLTLITPASGIRGTSVPVTLSGTNFDTGGFTVSAAGTGFTSGSFVVQSATTATGTISFDALATFGPRALTVTTTAGSSPPRNFTVAAPAPVVTAITPSSGLRGSTTAVTLTGANFSTGGFAITTGIDPNLTVSNVVVVNDTTVTAQFTVAFTAIASDRSFTVSTANGGSVTAVFKMVDPTVPTLTSITPTFGNQGATFPITVTGTNFIQTTAGSASGLSISAGTNFTVTVNSIDTLNGIATGTASINAIAVPGDRAITVTTAGGTSNGKTFRVLEPPAPVLTSLTPATGLRDTQVTATLTGTGFDTSGFTLSAGPNIGVTLGATSATSSIVTFNIGATAAFGSRGVTAHSIGGTSNTLTFTVQGPGPTFTAITPAVGSQGQSVPVTLTGSGFNTGGFLINAGPNITVNPVVVAVGGTSATATFIISLSATLGDRSVTVSTNTGAASPLPFTVLRQLPQLTSITPNTGAQGTSVPVTLSGLNFDTGGFTINAGINTTGTTATVINATLATATLTISPIAAAGTLPISVTTAGGTSNTVNFTVKLAAPTLSAITPAAGPLGASTQITLTGTNFTSDLTVNGGADITAGTVTVQSTTTAITTLAIGTTATQGPRSLTVSTSTGTSGPVTFTVLPLLPVLTSISPNTGGLGAVVPVTLSGANFDTGGFTLNITGAAGVLRGAVNVVSATTATATLTIDPTVATGPRSITVTTVAGTSNALNFTVASVVPTIFRLNPATGLQGTTVNLTVSGGGFVSGGTTLDAGANIAVGALVVTGGITITTTLTIAPEAVSGNRVITVTTSTGTSNGPNFLVQGARDPELSNIIPASGSQGTTVLVTLTGTGFIAGLSIDAGAGIAASAPVVASNGLSATAALTIGVGAAAGPRGITILTVGGTSSPFTFNVLAAQPPVLTAVNPPAGSLNAVVPITLTGVNLIAGLTLDPGSGITSTTPVPSNNATSATATLTIDAAAPTGPRNLTVTTAAGTASVAFTVSPLAPILQTMVPGGTISGATVPVTLYGLNFDTGGFTVNGPAGTITISDATAVNSTTATATFSVSRSASSGPYPISVTTAGGTSGTQNFTIAAASPRLIAITPNSIPRGGANVTVSLSGANFSPEMTVTLSGTGISYSDLVVVSATTATMKVTSDILAFAGTIDPVFLTATYVPRQVRVVQPEGQSFVTSNPLNLQLNFAPSINTLTPTIYAQGQTYVVTFTGSNYRYATTQNPGIGQPKDFESCTGPTPVGYLGTTAGPGNCTFAAGAGGWYQGLTVNSTPGEGVVVDENVLKDPSTGSTFTTSITISPTAPLGIKWLTIRTSQGRSNSVEFEITGQPIISSITPAFAQPGQTIPVTIVGVGFTGTDSDGDGTVDVPVTANVPAGLDLSLGTINAIGTVATGTITIDTDQVFGPRSISLNTKFGLTNSVTFNVIAPATPTLSTISVLAPGVTTPPAKGAQGTTVTVALKGGNFISGATTANVGGGGITVSDLTIFDYTLADCGPVQPLLPCTAQAKFTIAPNATLGAHLVTISTSSAQFGQLIVPQGVDFTVLPPVPTFTAITPSGGPQGGRVVATLTGTNFGTGLGTDFGTGLSLNVGAGTSIIVSSVVVVNGTLATATLDIALLAPVGDRAVAVVTASGSSASLPFTIRNAQTSIITAVTPSSGAQGTSVPITLTGTDFITGLSVALRDGTFADSNVTYSSVQVLDTTTVTATLNLGPHGFPGGRSIVVATTSGGTSSSIPFTVVASTPRFSTITPTSGSVGTSVPVVVTGSFFNRESFAIRGGSEVTFNLNGINAIGTVASGTLVIGAGAVQGPRGVVVTTFGGTSESQTFTVLAPVPTLTGITPSFGTRGSQVTVTLTGTNFDTGGFLISTGTTAGVTVSLVSVLNGTSATATFTIGSAVAAGNRGVTVFTAGGTSSPAVSFIVQPPVPTLTNVTPAVGPRGTIVPITVTGSNFLAGQTTLSVSGTGVTISGFSFVNTTSATATLTLDLAAELGDRSLQAVTLDVASVPLTFTVQGPPLPNLISISPSQGNQGSPVAVTLTGTNLLADMTINGGADITASLPGINVFGTSATATLTVGSAAALGSRPITVTTSGGNSTIPFMVLPPLATLTSISPSTGGRGGSVPITLTGTNLDAGGLTINIAGTGYTVNALNVSNSTTATATLVLDAAAAATARAVTVTTVNGTSTTSIAFTITGIPTLSSIVPPSIPRGVTAPVTLTGTDFIVGSATTIAVGSNIAVTGVNVVNSTTATANFAVAGTAVEGPRSLAIVTVNGTSNTITFNVQAPLPPTLGSITPTSGRRGTSVLITLNGTDFTTGLTVNAGSDITTAAPPVITAGGTTATVTLIIGAAAALGDRPLTAVTSGITGGTVTFTVLPVIPVLTSITPNSRIQGNTVAVTLIGRNFDLTNGFVINIAGTGVTASGITAVVNGNTTTATATFTLEPDAAPGVRGVAVTTSGGISNAVNFTVIRVPPVLTSITPNVGLPGTTVPVTLTGANFNGTTFRINNSTGTGITFTILTVVSNTGATQATANFVIAPNAAFGPRGITASATGGTSAPVDFTVVSLPPTLTSVEPSNATPNTTNVPITLRGSRFIGSVVVNVSGTGLTLSSANIVDSTTATVTLSVDAAAMLGARVITVTTPGGASNAATLNIVPPFPDLTISSSHSGTFGVGFTEPYTVTVTNVGTLVTNSTVVVTDVLPAGLTFVSGTGTGWGCSATLQTVTCSNTAAIAPLASAAALTINVAVGKPAIPNVTHSVSVFYEADLNPFNNTASDATLIVDTPVPAFTFNPSTLGVGQQATMLLTIGSVFPHDVTGTVTLSFVPFGALPDDPAIQFATGGRLVSFTIPANTLTAQFGAAPAGPIGFQTGTVAGTLTFSGVLQAGSVTTAFAPTTAVSGGLSIPLQPPTIQSIQTTSVPQGSSNGLPVNLITVQITLVSTIREVTELTLQFNTTPTVRLNCGNVSGCSTRGNSMTFYVKPLFDAWFAQDTTFGSLSTLKMPLAVAGSVQGSITVTLRNSQGDSNSVSFDLP